MGAPAVRRFGGRGGPDHRRVLFPRPACRAGWRPWSGAGGGRCRRCDGWPRGGSGPIVLTSLLFAASPLPGRYAADRPALPGLSAGGRRGRPGCWSSPLPWPGCGWHAGATAADLGWCAENGSADVKLGLAAFLAVAVPVYAVQMTCVPTVCLLPQYIAPDPVPLFFFALALGATVLPDASHLLPVGGAPCGAERHEPAAGLVWASS